MNEKGEVVAYVKNERGTQFDFHSFRRIRHISGQGLISDDVTICDTCKSYENTLRKTRSRISDEPERKKMPVSDTSKVNYRYLKKEELIERLSNTQKEKSKPIKTTMKMSILISTCIKDEGVEADSAQHETLCRVIETTEPDFDENSLQWYCGNNKV